ncbi:MAG: hypothetical protein MJA30_24225 [Cytophagales bacterium]|nr:hypothetical protein [Cytophagales bacterium]
MLTPTQISAWLILIVSAMSVSCDEDSQEDLELKGTLNLSIPGSQMGNAEGRAHEASAATYVLVSLGGPTALTMEKINVYPFEATYISESIALLEGEYQLLDFIVLNEQDEVIYAAPKEGSELEALVDQPLPLSFNISGDESTSVQPQVVRTLSSQPSQFGYSSFGFEIQETYRVAAFGNGTFVEAELQIWAGGSLLGTETLEANTNQVAIAGGYDSYELVVEAPGFARYHETFTSNDLESLQSVPLVINLTPAFTFKARFGSNESCCRKLFIGLTGGTTLYVDYGGSLPKDTITAPGAGEIEIEFNLNNAEPFISIAGGLDKVSRLQTDYELTITQMDILSLVNLKTLMLLGPNMAELSFNNGSPIETLDLFGGYIDTLDISNLHKLTSLSISTPPGQYGTLAQTISKKLYESLQEHPRQNGWLSLDFFTPGEDLTYMDLIKNEYGWDVYDGTW